MTDGSRAATEMVHLRATQTAYDTVAVDYAELLSAELEAKPLDRALLAAFAELVQATSNGPVADLGCGPGRVTAHLHSLGLNTFGIDLSPAMITVARQTHPNLRFDEGSITDLDLTDSSLTGQYAWVTSKAIGQARVVATSGNLADTLVITVYPDSSQASLAASRRRR